MEAKCVKCGVTALITNVRADGFSFLVKPDGVSLADVCPVVKKRAELGHASSAEFECPHLKAALETRVERLRSELE